MSSYTQQRRQSRELALQVLFQKEFSSDIDPQQVLQNFKQSFNAEADVWDYAEKLLTGFYQHNNEVDETISKNSSHWTIERMALVDLNILRIACVELLYLDSTPPKVVINEAIEIAKKYGTTDSASFINGVLDQTLKMQNT